MKSEYFDEHNLVEFWTLYKLASCNFDQSVATTM